MKKSFLSLLSLPLFVFSSGEAVAADLFLENTFALDDRLAFPNSNFHPQGIGYDSSANELLFIQQSSRTIYRTDLNGSIIGSLAVSLNFTTSIAADSSNYYLSDYQANGNGLDLYRIDKITGVSSPHSSEVAGYGGYPIDVRDGKLYRTEVSTQYNYSDLDKVRISSIGTPDDIEATLDISIPNGIGDFTVDTGSNSLFVLDYSSSAQIRRYNLLNGDLLDTYAPTLDGLTGGLTFANNKLYYYDWNRGTGSSLSVFNLGGMAAVPEPATWAFMIFGFGAIGGAMRSRRRGAKHSLRFSYS